MRTGTTELSQELERRSVMRGAMWEDLAQLSVIRPWPELRHRFIDGIQQEFAKWINPSQPHFAEQLLFAVGRFDEGAGIARFLALNGYADTSLRVIDIGAGNGGVAFALANWTNCEMHTLDIVPNAELASLRRVLDSPVHATVAVGQKIPMTDESFDVVLLLDTLEHVARPRELAAEIMRILRPGGFCMITTPPRIRHLLSPDPHYGIRGLVLFPNAVQRWIVNSLYKRRVMNAQGVAAPAYDVEHIYWHVREIARLFPSPATIDVLFNRTYRPVPFLSRATLKRPMSIMELIGYHLREWSWDRVLIRKPLVRRESE